jgi:Fe-coproporphyrin III synthase
MIVQTIHKTFQRYRTLQTDIITSLPIVILMPHSACNCQCVMCDIWKDNKNAKSLSYENVQGLISSLRKFNTRQVVMSGGEALLNPRFFTFCQLLRKENIKISLLSTGLLLRKNADNLLQWVNDIIVSLDGPQDIHDLIRNIPGSYGKLKDGIQYLHAMDPDFRITGRSVIQRMNFRQWPDIIRCALAIGLNQISFLPADVSSHAFNRPLHWEVSKQEEILLRKDDLPVLQEIIQQINTEFAPQFQNRFIAESMEKLQKIYFYYAAFHGLNPFPYKKCNAPWVSTVIEADGTVRPCFFHKALGNIKDSSLPDILNSLEAIRFRKSLDTDKDSTCNKCVCYLNLSPRMNPDHG